MTAPRMTVSARLLLSVVLGATIATQIAFTWLGWSGHHVFNPQWHPHARYHAAWTVAFVVVMAVVGLWLLRPRSGATRSAVRVVAIPMAVFWATEFFAAAVPGTDPSPDLTAPNTVDLFGLQVHGNLLFAAAMIVLSVVGGLLAEVRTPSSPDTEPAPR